MILDIYVADRADGKVEVIGTLSYIDDVPHIKPEKKVLEKLKL